MGRQLLKHPRNWWINSPKKKHVSEKPLACLCLLVAAACNFFLLIHVPLVEVFTLFGINAPVSETAHIVEVTVQTVPKHGQPCIETWCRKVSASKVESLFIAALFWSRDPRLESQYRLYLDLFFCLMLTQTELWKATWAFWQFLAKRLD